MESRRSLSTGVLRVLEVPAPLVSRRVSGGDQRAPLAVTLNLKPNRDHCFASAPRPVLKSLQLMNGAQLSASMEESDEPKIFGDAIAVINGGLEDFAALSQLLIIPFFPQIFFRLSIYLRHFI